MSAPTSAGAGRRADRVGTAARPAQLTLYQLVEAVAEVAADEREVVAVVRHLLASGRPPGAGAAERGSEH